MSTWLLFLLTLGAVLRVTRIITADYITQPLRERLINRWGENSQRAYLVTCDYCASFWVAIPLAATAVLWGDNRVVIIAFLALTASWFSGFMAGRE